MAVDAAGVGAFDWVLATDELRWDDRLLQIFGVTREGFGATIGAFTELVHPEDRERVRVAMTAALEACSTFEAEYRIVRPSGVTRWITARGLAVAGPDGKAARLVGAAYDTTAQKDEDARVLRVLETMPSAFYHLDREWRFRYVNHGTEQLLGRSRDALLGRSLWELYPQSEHDHFGENFRRAVDTGEPVAFTAQLQSGRSYELSAWPTPDGLSVYFNDVTIHLDAQHRLDAAAHRAQTLARITDRLIDTLDVQGVAEALGPALVPALAEWCIVTLVEGPQSGDWRRGLRDVASWHEDPLKRPQLRRYADIRLPALKDSAILARSLNSQRPVRIPGDATAILGSVLEPGEARDIAEQFAPHSAVMAPLRGRQGPIGVLGLFRGGRHERFSPDDLELIDDIAARVGLALDNARLFAEQREAAATLQRAMLSEPDAPPGIEVVVRYEPAADASQVGGDWYDSFPSGDSTVVVIGDVAGHDIRSAAAMGQLRSLLRGISLASGSGPADLLAQVDRAMATMLPDTTATAVMSKLTRTPDGVILRWANAGHPAPVVLTPAGVARSLGSSDDPLLGLGMELERSEHSVLLAPGSTVFFCTDGLVERRNLPIEIGLAALRHTLASLTDIESLDELCDQVLSRLLPAYPDDDVALLAVRVS